MKNEKNINICMNRVDWNPVWSDYNNMMRTELDFTKTIPASYAGAASHKLEKIITRANKKGLEGMLGFTISDPYIKETAVSGLEISVVDIAVSGVVPQINGWDFIGKLTHDAGDFVVVMTAPGKEIPSKYRNSTGECDHCGRIRNRKDTFVLLKDGEYQEVGRTCLKDFFPKIDV